MRIDPKYAGAVASVLAKKRRSVGAASPEAFARIYLAPLFDRPFCPMHTELFAELAGMGMHNLLGERRWGTRWKSGCTAVLD